MLQLPIALEPPPAEWLACIDFGTSSTTIWIGRYRERSKGLLLRLGDWLASIDPADQLDRGRERAKHIIYHQLAMSRFGKILLYDAPAAHCAV